MASLQYIDVGKRELAIEAIQDAMVAALTTPLRVHDLISVVSDQLGYQRVDVSFALMRATGTRVQVMDGIVSVLW
ncbi:MAG: hypothetical protein ACYCU8_01220 [Ferrimicrobium acidiphilum]